MTTVTIHQSELAEPGLLTDVLQRIQAYEHLTAAAIHVAARVPADAPSFKHPGWLEYVVVAEYSDGSKMTVGCIQRSIGAPTEFHT